MVIEIEILLEEVRKIIVPSTKKNLELTIIEEVKEKGCCNYNLIEPIEEIITTYLESSSEERLKAIYEETEIGLINNDVHELEIGFLRMVLEEELLGELTEDIFSRAEVK